MRSSIRSPLFLLGVVTAFIITPSANAQVDTVFTVTVENKTSAHTEHGEGWGEGFAIDEQQAMPVAVIRGRTYIFQLEDVATLHTFYTTTSDVGLGADPYEEGVEGNFATGNETVTFTPTEDTPDLLYYQCGTHDNMGWRIYVMDEEEIGLETIAEGLTSPLTLAEPEDGTDRLFIVDQAGQIRIITADGNLLEAPLLDLSDQLIEFQEGFDERGLLGLAMHPEFGENGLFYVYYSAPLRDGAPEGWDHTATISEFQVATDDPNVADPESERILLQVDEPQFNHDGGTLAFGPDGFLYISLGDGGGANDNEEGHVADWYDANEGGNAQDVEANLLGNILRIDVDTGDPYGIPSDNPFVDVDGMDEIFAYGLRNPYRMSFDMGGEHGLLVGDAGQNRWEEVSQVSLGANLGWNVKEGTHCFSTANPDADAESCPDEVGSGHPDEGAPLVNPVIEYQNANAEGGLGLVVVGGYIYRGTALPDFEGKYFFGDWSFTFTEPEGLVFLATPQDEGRWPFQTLSIAGSEDGELHQYVLGFGQDNDGEVYVLTTEMTAPTGQTGQVRKIVDPSTIIANEPGDELPTRLTLEQNYPNPFNPTTTISFVLPVTGRTTLKIYDLLGREVASLLDGVLAAGPHAVTWNVGDEADGLVSSGSYIYRLQGPDRTVSKVMTVVK